MVAQQNTIRHVVLFDGTCLLCNETMRFIYHHDRQQLFWFASLQGKFARELRERLTSIPEELNSVVLIENYGRSNEQIYLRSEAALRMVSQLSGGWPIIGWARIIPRPLRDAVYSWVARHRYRWFGQKESCDLPDPQLKTRILDS